MKSGNILLSVQARGEEQLASAKKIFQALGALDIFLAASMLRGRTESVATRA